MEFIFRWQHTAAKYVKNESNILFINWNWWMIQDVEYTFEERCNIWTKWFEKRGYDLISIGNLRSDWYQNPETYGLLEVIQEKIKEWNYKEIISYGGSLWWYAALAFSKATSATKVCVFTPQILLEKYPWWIVLWQRYWLDNIFKIQDWLSTTADIFVYYGDEIQDKDYAENDLVKICKDIGNQKLHLIKVPYDIHWIMLEMVKTTELEMANDYVLSYNPAYVYSMNASSS